MSGGEKSPFPQQVVKVAKSLETRMKKATKSFRKEQKWADGEFGQRGSAVENAVFVCLCADLSLYLQNNECMI